ncbi:MAG: hypothetical protein JWN17_795, partial [Frankiales bacterium]|nr:hypothetical protein [Frankiales bacterium]
AVVGQGLEEGGGAHARTLGEPGGRAGRDGPAQTGRVTRPVLLPAALLAAALALSACNGDASSSASSDAAAPLTGASSAAPSTVPSAATTSGAPASAKQTPSAGAAPSADAPSASARSAAPALPTSRPAARTAGSPSLATRAGRYTYDAKGTVTAGGAPHDASGTATLTVDEPVGDTQSTVLEGDQGRTETDTQLKSTGRYVTRLLLTTPAFSKEFRPVPAALLLPEPATVGRSWSWSGTSTDGKTRVTATSRVLRSETVTVGGTSVPTRVVETRLVLRGDVVYDGTTTTDVATGQRLPVREHGTGKGTISGIPFSTDTSSTLRSLDPS